MCTFGMEGPSPTGSNTASGEIVEPPTGPEERRAAIVAAARVAFSELGFGKTTIREVARRVEVTHGLVIRHFGSKEQLFLAAVPSPRTLMAQVAGDPRSLPTRSARSYVRRMTLSGGNSRHTPPLRPEREPHQFLINTWAAGSHGMSGFTGLQIVQRAGLGVERHHPG